MSSVQLIDCGVEHRVLNGMGVIQQDFMDAVLLDGKIEFDRDIELIPLLGIEVGNGVTLPVERIKRSVPSPPMRVSSPRLPF